MPTVYTAELEVIILLILLAYYSHDQPAPNWALIVQILNEILENGDANTITADALRQRVTKKMMRRVAFLKFFEHQNNGNGNGNGGAGGAGAAGTAA
jgi:hypothetical protein